MNRTTAGLGLVFVLFFAGLRTAGAAETPKASALSAGTVISGSTDDWIAKFAQSGKGRVIELEQSLGEGDLIRGVTTSRRCTVPSGQSCSSDSDCVNQCKPTFRGGQRACADGQVCSTDADCRVRGRCSPQ